MNRLKRLHLLWGWLSAASFSLTGLWMQANFPEAFHGDAGMRMAYRSAHVYVLLAGISNALLGVYLVTPPTALRRTLQRAGSALVLLAPVLFTIAFFAEPAPASMARPFSTGGLASMIFGGLLHLASQRGLGDRVALAAAAAEAAGEDAVSRAASALAARLGGALRRRWRILAALAVLAGLVLGGALARRGLVSYRVAHRAGVEGLVADTLARTTIAITGDEKRSVERAVRTGARFANVGEGTVIDTETNLMWAARDNRNGTDWQTAAQYAAGYRAGGYDDWRLPTVPELLELARGAIDASAADQDAIPSLDSHLPVGYGVPWSAERRGDEAARVDVGSGAVGWLPATSTSHNRALPVRDGRKANPAIAPYTSRSLEARTRHFEEVTERLFAGER